MVFDDWIDCGRLRSFFASVIGQTVLVSCLVSVPCQPCSEESGRQEIGEIAIYRYSNRKIAIYINNKMSADYAFARCDWWILTKIIN